jgi:hypothetical protein
MVKRRPTCCWPRRLIVVTRMVQRRPACLLLSAPMLIAVIRKRTSEKNKRMCKMLGYRYRLLYLFLCSCNIIMLL